MLGISIAEETCFNCGERASETDKVCRNCGTSFSTRPKSAGLLRRVVPKLAYGLSLVAVAASPWVGVIPSSAVIWLTGGIAWSRRRNNPFVAILFLAFWIPGTMLILRPIASKGVFAWGYHQGVQAADEAMRDGRTHGFAHGLSATRWCVVTDPYSPNFQHYRGFEAGAIATLPEGAGDQSLAVKKLATSGAKFFQSSGAAAIVLSGNNVTTECVELLQAGHRWNCVVLNTVVIDDKFVSAIKHVPADHLVVGQTRLSRSGLLEVLNGRRRNAVWIDPKQVDVDLRAAAAKGGAQLLPLDCRNPTGRQIINRVLPWLREVDPTDPGVQFRW